MAFSAACKAHAGPAPEAKPDYNAVRRRAGESLQDLQAEGNPGGLSRSAPEASSVEAAPKAAAAPKVMKGSRPDWVDGASMEYPRESYLTGVGMADDRATSQDRSRAEISKIFSTMVSVKTNLSETETNLQQNGKSANAFSQSISQDLQTASQKALEGVEIVELWQDQATRNYYALAVLDRAKAIRTVGEKIADFDRQAQRMKSQLDSSSEKLPKVKAAMKILSLLKARASLNSVR